MQELLKILPFVLAIIYRKAKAKTFEAQFDS